MAAPPPYQKSTYAESLAETFQTLPRPVQLRQKIEKYRPGSTIRTASERPKDPPKATRIGLFGGPGVGKSALINSFLYVTGDMWSHMAPEAFQGDGASFTMRKTSFGLTEHLAVCDNRGLQDFSGRYMTEVGQQLGIPPLLSLSLSIKFLKTLLTVNNSKSLKLILLIFAV